MRLDAHDLHIETDDKGFIIGESLIGDVIMDEAHAWREVRTDFSNLNLNMSVSVDKGVLFRPETSSVTLRTPVTDWMSGVFGRRLRIRWKDSILFTGFIKSATLSSTAEHEGDKTYMNISAYSVVELMNKFVLYNFSAPEQSVEDRVVLAAAALGINVQTIECDRMMAALPAGNYKLMEVLQEASDAQLARFYVDRENTLIMDGSTPPEPSILFSDDEEDPNHVCYRSLGMEENVNNSITGVIAQAKQDDSVYVVRRLDSAVVTHEETYEIDVPANTESLNSWALSFPLLGYTRILPVGIDTYFQEQLLELGLTDVVDVKWKSNNYRAGVQGISYSIRPTRDDRLVWDTSIELMPGHLIDFTSVSAPSVVRDFMAVANTPDTVSLSWTRPQMFGDATGYMIRYRDGKAAPMKPTEGFLVAELGLGSTSFTHTGQPSRDTNSYSVWAITGNAAVYSPVVTATVTTPEIIPSAARNFTAAKDRTDGYMANFLDWDLPTTTGDIDGFYYTYTLDGTTPSWTNGEKSQAHYNGGGFTPGFLNTSANVYFDYTPAERNKTVKYALWPRTHNDQLGPVVYAQSDTNEIIPPASTVSLQQILPNQYVEAQVRIFWGNQAQAGIDFKWYRIEYNVQKGGPPLTPGAGTLVGEWSASGAASANYRYDIYTPRNVFIDVSVFGLTWGGKFVRSSAYLFIPA